MLRDKRDGNWFLRVPSGPSSRVFVVLPLLGLILLKGDKLSRRHRRFYCRYG